jgi:hypothetical protein
MFKPRSIEEESFVNEPFYFSYSSLNKLIFSPKLFYTQYVLKQKEEKLESYLVEGKIIHCLLLEEENFNNQFIISPLKVPNASNKVVIDKVFLKRDTRTKFSDYKDEIIEVLKEVDLHQSLKTDEQRIAKILIPENELYFEFLKQRENKIIIDQQTYDKCRRGVDQIKQNKDFQKNVITKSEWELLECHNEYYLQYWDPELEFGIKGIIDNLVIDYENKVVKINDIKTTSKSLVDFKDTVEYYNYWLQAAMYKRLVTKVLIEKMPKPKDWKINVNFVVYDAYDQVYCFPVSETSQIVWNHKLSEKLDEAKYFLENGNFTLPYQFQVGSVLL